MKSVRPFRQYIRPDDNQTKRTATMKLSTTTFVSVDGIVQGIGGPVIR
jgi:hypothetical protein